MCDLPERSRLARLQKSQSLATQSEQPSIAASNPDIEEHQLMESQQDEFGWEYSRCVYKQGYRYQHEEGNAGKT